MATTTIRNCDFCFIRMNWENSKRRAVVQIEAVPADRAEVYGSHAETHVLDICDECYNKLAEFIKDYAETVAKRG